MGTELIPGVASAYSELGPSNGWQRSTDLPERALLEGLAEGRPLVGTRLSEVACSDDYIEQL